MVCGLSCCCSVPSSDVRLDDRSGQGKGGDRAFGGSINKKDYEVMLYATKITPMHVLSLKPSHFWEVEREIIFSSNCDILIPIR